MVDTATTKAVPAAPANASRQGYWRGVLRRLLRDPGGGIRRRDHSRSAGPGAVRAVAYRQRPLSNVDVPAPEAHRQRRLPAGL